MWPQLKTLLEEMIGEIKTGDPTDFKYPFMEAEEYRTFFRVYSYLSVSMGLTDAALMV